MLVLTLEATGEWREVQSGALAVGRRNGEDSEEQFLVLGDTSCEISRRHCRFVMATEGASVTDLRSTNGTRVDGVPASPDLPVSLHGGEVVELGDRRLRVEITEAWLLPPAPLAEPEETLLPW